MVESKLVELVVAGSNPVGHPIFIPNAYPSAKLVNVLHRATMIAALGHPLSRLK